MSPQPKLNLLPSSAIAGTPPPVLSPTSEPCSGNSDILAPTSRLGLLVEAAQDRAGSKHKPNSSVESLTKSLSVPLAPPQVQRTGQQHKTTRKQGGRRRSRNKIPNEEARESYQNPPWTSKPTESDCPISVNLVVHWRYWGSSTDSFIGHDGMSRGSSTSVQEPCHPHTGLPNVARLMQVPPRKCRRRKQTTTVQFYVVRLKNDFFFSRHAFTRRWWRKGGEWPEWVGTARRGYFGHTHARSWQLLPTNSGAAGRLLFNSHVDLANFQPITPNCKLIEPTKCEQQSDF